MVIPPLSELLALLGGAVPALALLLVAAGVVGVFVPLLPSGLLSLAGVLLYWWGSGFTEPNLLVLSGLVFLALLVTAVEWLAGAISAKAGGASTVTTVVATVVGLVAMLVWGPVGFLAGTAGTVLVAEVLDGKELGDAVRAAGVTLVGMLTSNLVGAILSLSILAVMVLVVLL